MTDKMALGLADNLLKEYDLYHSSLIYGGKIKFNINYLFDGKVYVSLVGLINDEEKKSTYDFENDDYFNKVVLPKIIERFLSKNVGIKSRRIMGNEETGTYIVEREDLKDYFSISHWDNGIYALSAKDKNVINNEKEFLILLNPTSSAITFELDDYYTVLEGVSEKQEIKVKNGFLPGCNLLVLFK